MNEYTRNNAYVIDPDLMEEMHRLDMQGRVLTEAMGGVFAERPDFSRISRVLDLACGSAEWALTVAQAHPTLQVMGIDIAPRMIEFASALAHRDRLHNATFQVGDITQALPFPDVDVDLINARFMQGFMKTTDWPPLLKECWRLLRPGGLIRLTENERHLTNSAAWEEMMSLIMRAMSASGKSFSPDGLHLGMFFMFRRLLEEAGFQHIQERAYVINFSSGTAVHHNVCQEMTTAMRLIQPFLVKVLPDRTLQELEQLRERVLEEVQSSSFCGVWLLLSATGEKPNKESSTPG